MLKDHEILRIGTPEGGLKFEVNWSDSDDVKDCKMIRVIPDEKGKPFVIRKEELNAILFAFGNKAEQMKMIPVVETRSRHYETVLGITATKAIAKGEKIVVPVSIPLPSFDEEIISEAKRDITKHHSGALIL